MSRDPRSLVGADLLVVVDFVGKLSEDPDQKQTLKLLASKPLDGVGFR